MSDFNDPGQQSPPPTEIIPPPESGEAESNVVEIPQTEKTSAPRRPKGLLERRLMEACNLYVTGQFRTEKACLTAQLAANLIADAESAAASRDGQGPKYAPPSAGAVTNILKKWKRAGYAEVLDKPFGFVGYTNAAYEYENADAMIAASEGQSSPSVNAAAPSL